MKSEQNSDEVAAAMGGFNSTENAVFDFIRDSGLHHKVISSRQELLGAISLKVWTLFMLIRAKMPL